MQSQLKSEINLKSDESLEQDKKKKRNGASLSLKDSDDAIETEKKTKKTSFKTSIEDDSLIKFSKLLINTKRLTVVEKFVESLEQF